jgi:hypothetical protein
VLATVVTVSGLDWRSAYAVPGGWLVAQLANNTQQTSDKNFSGTCRPTQDRNHSTGLANNTIIIRPTFGPASSIPKSANAAYLREAEIPSEHLTPLIKVIKFMIFKPPARTHLVLREILRLHPTSRKLRQLRLFEKWFHRYH